MKPTIVFAIPGELTTPTGGYLYDRKLIEGLRALGYQVIHLELGPSFPFPSASDQLSAAELLGAVAKDDLLIIDGLALGALNNETVAAVPAKIIALVHHPLAFETGLSPEDQKRLFGLERANLASATAVIATSNYTATQLVSDYGVDPQVVSVAEPGSSLEIKASNPQTPPLILSVGIELPRKGHDILLRALAQITHLQWQAVIAGAELDTNYSRQLRDLQHELGLESRVEIAGYVPDQQLADLYASATIFALATRFEGYGIAFNEAMAAGLAIISSRVGAVPATLAGVGLLVEPESAAALAGAIELVLSDSRKRDELMGLARARAKELPTWSQTALRVAEVLDNLSEAS